MNEFKPCPAGHKNLDLVTNSADAVFVECADCGWSGPPEDTVAKAISAWNDRKPENAATEEVVRPFLNWAYAWRRQFPHKPPSAIVSAVCGYPESAEILAGDLDRLLAAMQKLIGDGK